MPRVTIPAHSANRPNASWICCRARGGERVDVWADAGCNDLFGNVQEDATIREAHIALQRDDIRSLYYDFEVLYDMLKALPKESLRYHRILTALHDASLLLRDFSPREVGAARRRLAEILRMRGGDAFLNVSAIGHAHIDLAWLWPVRETIRKGARTFATVLDLMNRYPDYVFGASQPQLLLWMKEQYPALYAKLRRRVREGRFDVQGAMWVEADVNISGGEALVRQVLHGKRFWRSEFGVEMDYLWLPDVFGYNAALPQILRKSGVRHFMTQKMSWNLVNYFPHHSFRWRGLDGSEVLAHLPPEDTYNSPALPRSLNRIETNYRDKNVSASCLMLYGIGDGGGGPGEEHLESLARIGNLAGLPRVRQETAARFFRRWARDAGRFPTWIGELYLEQHQGTFTTNARNKWYNRRMEQALRDLEWYATLAHTLAGRPYPSTWLENTWREVLLYQFHDILPGSSIKRVYDESVARYQILLRETLQRIDQTLRVLAPRVSTAGLKRPVIVFNSLSWDRREWLKVNGRWAHVQAPAMGYVATDLSAATPPPRVSASPARLENERLRVRFARDGSVTSVFDKEHRREVLDRGRNANRLAVYADHGDAWDFPMDYAAQSPRTMKLVSARARVDGPRASVIQEYRLGHSRLTQEISLTSGGRRLEFETHVTWREPRSMLRTSFPVSVQANDATFEIQYGHIRRPTHHNTTWDLARDEVPAQKWADLSLPDYGVALLNDSKYGHKVKGNVLELNLLRSVPYAGPRLVRDEQVQPGEPHHGYTDQFDHVFRYALLPHSGDHRAGGVVAEAYAFNHPLHVVSTRPRTSHAAASAAFLRVDDPHIVVEAVKKAEDSDDIIVRLYETGGHRTRTELHCALPVRAVFETDLMEEHGVRQPGSGARLSLDFAPFEIKTLRFRRARR